MNLLHDNYGLEYSTLDKGKKLKVKIIFINGGIKEQKILPYDEILIYL